MLKYPAPRKDPARRWRRTLPDSEAALWSRLRKKQLLGSQCYRQTPIGEHRVDLVAPRAALVGEGEGSQHRGGDHARKDRSRDRDLVSLGLQVVRFNRRAVLEARDAVVEAIDRTMAEQLRAQIPPGPPWIKGG